MGLRVLKQVSIRVQTGVDKGSIISQAKALTQKNLVGECVNPKPYTHFYSCFPSVGVGGFTKGSIAGTLKGILKGTGEGPRGREAFESCLAGLKDPNSKGSRGRSVNSLVFLAPSRAFQHMGLEVVRL